MGGNVSFILGSVLRQNSLRVLMVGLEGAGKTTMLYKLKLGEVVTTIPTRGMNVESVRCQNVEFCLWDIGGADHLKPLWRHYFQNTQGIIYVVDSADANRLDEAKHRMNEILSEDSLEGVPLLVLGNKHDLPGAVSRSELTLRLGLLTLRGRRWDIRLCSATTGDGVYEGLEWMATVGKN